MKCRDCEKWGWGDDEGTPVWGWCWKYTSCPDPDIDRSCPDFSPKKPDIFTTFSTLQAENKKLRAELENYRKGHREEAISTLTPLNEWVNRVRELDELYTKLQIITGFTVEQLLEMFAAGYTLEKPDYSKSFEEMASLAETTPPNEPLTLEELREMDEPVWVACKPIEGGNGYWCLCQHGHIITPAGSIYDVKEIPHWVFYRRPLEEEV